MPPKNKNIVIDNWKEMAVNFLQIAFVKYFWRTVFILIIVFSFVGGIAISRDSKGEVNITIEPILKDSQQKK